jgi:hypothetical protein
MIVAAAAVLSGSVLGLCITTPAYQNPIYASAGIMDAYVANLEDSNKGCVWHPVQCPLRSVCAVPDLWNDTAHNTMYTMWKCWGLALNNDSITQVGDNCDDGSSIHVFDRLTLPSLNETIDVGNVAACIKDSDCSNSRHLNELGTNPDSSYHCLGGKCVEWSNTYNNYPAFEFLRKNHIAFVMGACGTHGLRSRANMTRYEEGNTFDLKHRFECLDADYPLDNNPETNESTLIADACGLCAYDLAHDWNDRAIVNVSEGLACTVVGQSHPSIPGEIDCQAYFSDNIFISREGQYEYESLGEDRPAYLLVGQVPAKLSLPWRPFTISAPLATNDGKIYNGDKTPTFSKLVIDALITWRGGRAAQPSYTTIPTSGYVYGTSDFANGKGISAYYEQTFLDNNHISVPERKYPDLDIIHNTADYSEFEQAVWYNATIDTSNILANYTYIYDVDGHECRHIAMTNPVDASSENHKGNQIEKCCGRDSGVDELRRCAILASQRQPTGDLAVSLVSQDPKLKYASYLENSGDSTELPYPEGTTSDSPNGFLFNPPVQPDDWFGNFQPDPTKRYTATDPSIARGCEVGCAFLSTALSDPIHDNCKEELESIYQYIGNGGLRFTFVSSANEADANAGYKVGYELIIDGNVTTGPATLKLPDSRLNCGRRTAEEINKFCVDNPLGTNGDILFNRDRICGLASRAVSLGADDVRFDTYILDFRIKLDPDSTLADPTAKLNVVYTHPCDKRGLVNSNADFLKDTTYFSCEDQPTDTTYNICNICSQKELLATDITIRTKTTSNISFKLSRPPPNVHTGSGNAASMAIFDNYYTKELTTRSDTTPSDRYFRANHFLRFRYTNYMNQSGHGVLGEFYTYNTTSQVNPGATANDLRLWHGRTNTASNGLCCEASESFGNICPACSPDCLLSRDGICPQFVPTSPVLDLKTSNNFGLVRQAGPIIKTPIHAPNSTTNNGKQYGVLNYGLNRWSQRTTCDPFFEVPIGEQHKLTDSPVFGQAQPRTGGTTLFADFVVAPRTYNNGRGLYGVANSEDLADVDRRRFNTDPDPVAGGCRPIYRSNAYTYSGADTFTFYARGRFVIDGEAECSATADDGEYWTGPFVSRPNTSDYPSATGDVSAYFTDGTTATLYVHNRTNSTSVCGNLFNPEKNSTISPVSDKTLSQAYKIESAGATFLRDYCLRRDSGTLVRAPGGGPFGCAFPNLPGETRFHKTGSEVCRDDNDFTNDDCVYHVTGVYPIPPFATATAPPALFTTTPPPLAEDFPLNQTVVRDACPGSYIEMPGSLVSAAQLTFPITSASRGCRDQCDLEEQCAGFRYVEPECTLFRKATEGTVPIILTSGIDTTAPFVNCSTCDECIGLNLTHIRVTANISCGTQFFARQVILNYTGAVHASLFAGNSQLTAVQFDAGITSIGANAFAGTGIETFVAPAGLASIGAGAFSDCPGLTGADLTAAAPGLIIDSSAFSGSATSTIFFNGGNHSLSGIGNCKTLKSTPEYRFFWECEPWSVSPQYSVFKSLSSPVPPATASDFTIKYDTLKPSGIPVASTFYGLDMFACAEQCFKKFDQSKTAAWTGVTQKCRCLSTLAFADTLNATDNEKGELLISYDGGSKCGETTFPTTASPRTAATLTPDTPVAVYGKLTDAFSGLSYCSFSPAWVYPVFKTNSDDRREFKHEGETYYIDPSRPAGCTDTLPAGVEATTTTTTTTVTTPTTVTTTTPFFTEFTTDDELVATGVIASVASVAVGLVVVNVCINRRRARRYGPAD